MTNEMKLLRAFIEASGYEIEEVKTNESVRVIGVPDINETVIATIDYKLTKKPKLTITTRAHQIGSMHDFGESVL